ncbi:hypothetical protein LEP1GSC050_4235 [Leptospira broomii serovar Hurstbridge str. 5399]|uniref:GHKL domain protein n=1 Tax=Leptospira broomii serovar Hurstbridge str. 5399 TaxID=1049789 RepID=T0FDN9_9LEPT|nr:SiaB family protein kinase [Leptospira broomii]EQA45717.1 hypothetical protein LEP1GSC050_4235 [Leptospira broomii serovar Hurstbridge str. 5399]
MMDNEVINLFKSYKDASEYNLLVSFKGRLSQEVLTELGSMIRTSLSSESKIKKIFAVFIELAQNMLHYSAERQVNEEMKDAGVGILIVRENSVGYHVGSGNLVQNEKLEFLSERIQKINSMNKDELKSFYQQQLRSERPEDSKGAGVGLIDIARKSDGPLVFHFDSVDNKNSFFTISAFFTKEN